MSLSGLIIFPLGAGEVSGCRSIRLLMPPAAAGGGGAQSRAQSKAASSQARRTLRREEGRQAMGRIAVGRSTPPESRQPLALLLSQNDKSSVWAEIRGRGRGGEGQEGPDRARGKLLSEFLTTTAREMAGRREH